MNDLEMTAAEWAQAIQQMRSQGETDGRNGGAWIADGNTSAETLQAILDQWEEGDPNAPAPLAPFSGEWADSPALADIIDYATECDVESLTPEDMDELGTAYEDAFYAAWQESAESTVRGLRGAA